MNLFLKTLRLQNYCNYKDYVLNLTKPDGSPYNIVCFYGPNGIGKSTLLEAVSLLTKNDIGRTSQNVNNALRKYVRNPDYNPSYEKLTGFQYNNSFATKYEEKLADMLIEGTYVLDDKEYIVQINQNGFVRNDLVPMARQTKENNEEIEQNINNPPWGEDHLKYRQRIFHLITSDNDLSMSKFQLHIANKKNFEDIYSQIARMQCECMEPSGTTIYDKNFCTDMVLRKGSYNIHYKRMSAGEKKIAKSFSQLLNIMHALEYPDQEETAMPGWPPIIGMDNIVMHVYYDRHVDMIEVLKRVFNKQQILATTHSGTLISRFLSNQHDSNNELYIDLEPINIIA